METNPIFNKIKKYPVAFSGMIESVLYLLTEFGVDLNSSQQAAILLTVGAVLTFLTTKEVYPAQHVVTSIYDVEDPESAEVKG